MNTAYAAPDKEPNPKLEKRKKKNIASSRAVSTLVLCSLVILVMLLLGMRVYDDTQARYTLREARLVRLAMDTQYKTAYGTGAEFWDPTSFSGMTPESTDEVYKLSGCDGVFRLLTVDLSKIQITGLLYYEGGFAAQMSIVDGKTSWKVYKEQVYIGG